MSCALACLSAWPAAAQSNLCYNGSFTSPADPLDGWIIDYAWTGNARYVNNRSTVSALPEFKGRQHVMRLAYTYENKVECKPIEFELGARYQCTLDFIGDVPVRVNFNGYMWEPGVAPYPDPQIKDLRRIFKSEAFSGTANNWKSVKITFPQPEVSELAWSHLKQVRYFTVMVLVPAAGIPGKGTYVTNVKVIKLGQPVKVVKSTRPAGKAGTGEGD